MAMFTFLLYVGWLGRSSFLLDSEQREGWDNMNFSFPLSGGRLGWGSRRMVLQLLSTLTPRIPPDPSNLKAPHIV